MKIRKKAPGVTVEEWAVCTGNVDSQILNWCIINNYGDSCEQAFRKGSLHRRFECFFGGQVAPGD